MNRKKRIHGFTLLEILLVVAAIGILAGIVIIAINPGKQLADTRNAQRRADVNTVLNAVYQYTIDHSGVLPTDIDLVSDASAEICATGVASTTCSSITDLSVLVPDYIVSIPVDPYGAVTVGGTGYSVIKNVDGRITVTSLRAEQDATISVTR